MSELEANVSGMGFVDKLTYVVENGELDYWEDRENPPNLDVDQFRQVITRIESTIRPKIVTRESKAGPRGSTGEDNCFQFECSVEFGSWKEIEIKYYFIKGYFFDKGDLKGVTIQSFRKV